MRCHIGNPEDVCCNFYFENQCVAECPSNLTANETFDCSKCVCVCVCVFRVHLLFPWTLGTGKCFYGHYAVFSKYAICRFARQSLVFEIWQYLLTSKAFVSTYDSSKSKAVLSRLPFGLKYRTVQ